MLLSGLLIHVFLLSTNTHGLDIGHTVDLKMIKIVIKDLGTKISGGI